MRSERLFLFGVFVSRLGDSFSFLAFILILLENSASNALVSAFMVAHYLPGVLIGLLGGRCFDEIPKKAGLIISYLLSGGLTLLACWATSSPRCLLFISILLGVTYGIYVPLQKAFIAEVFQASENHKANASVQLAEISAKNIGFLLAGLVFHRMGASVSFSIDAFSFLAIAALISRIEIQTAGYNTPKDAVHQLKSHRPGLVFKSVVFASTWIGTGALFALEAGYAKTYLHASDAVVGWLFACATLGSIFVSKWNRYLGQISTTMKDRIFLFACVGELAFVASYVSVNSVFPALVCIIFYGLLLSLRNILIVSWIHLEIPKAEHGSAFAIQTGLANLAMMLGMGLSGPMAEVFGIRIVVLAAAGFGFVMVVLLNALQAHRENTSDLAEYSDLMCRR